MLLEAVEGDTELTGKRTARRETIRVKDRIEALEKLADGGPALPTTCRQYVLSVLLK